MVSKFKGCSGVVLSPTEICSTVMYDMADCFLFLIKGSTDNNPIPSCCFGFETVVQSNPPDFICEAFKNSADLGIDLNFTEVLTLPSACQVFDSPIDKCDGKSQLNHLFIQFF